MLFAVALLGGNGPLTADEPQEVKIAKVHAAVLANLPYVARWPEGAFESNSAPIILVVVGRDPFGRLLDATVAQVASRRKGDSREVRIERIQDASSVEAVAAMSRAHIAFIGDDTRAQIDALAAAAIREGVLTVGRESWALAAGGMIRLGVHKGKVAVDINVDAVDASRITLSADFKALKYVTLIRKGAG